MRISLRALTHADVEAHNAGEDEQTIRWLTGARGTVASTARWFDQLAANADAGRGVRGFGVCLDGRLAGYVEANPEAGDGLDPGDVNISYTVHPWARGRGVAVEAVHLICDFVRDHRLGTRAALRVEPENVASVRVAEKCGFRHVRDFASQTDRQPDGTPAVMSLYLHHLAPEVLLVRHAMPAASKDVAARDWPLSTEGLAAARRLRLPAGAVLVTSDEPKAAQTLRAACPGTDVLLDAGFGEVRRPDEWADDHRERARAYVEGARHTGWEPHDEVVARFEAAIGRHATPGRPLIVGTHGMAATLWLATRRPAMDPGTFWAALRFPDLIKVP